MGGARDEKLTQHFGDLIGACIKSAPLRGIKAYGFNYDYSIPNLRKAVELFKIKVPASGTFALIDQSKLLIKLEKKKVIYSFELNDGDPRSLIQINAHYDIAGQLNSLADDILSAFTESFSDAGLLIKELLGNG